MMRKKVLFGIVIVLISLGSFGCSENNSGEISNLPTPVTNLKVLTVGANNVRLSWKDNSTNEIGFKIEFRSETSNYSLAGSTNSNDTSFTVQPLTANTTYYFRVYSFNSAGNSPTYSNIVSATTICGVQIGTQFWSCKNLDTRFYRNGDPIPQASFTGWADLTTGAWCYYNNDSSNLSKYGRLYNWYALNDPRGFAPNGWHVATVQDWGKLCVEISTDGGKLKEAGTVNWLNPNVGATNSTGFSALPGGRRTALTLNSGFSSLGSEGWWWGYSASSFNGFSLRNSSATLFDCTGAQTANKNFFLSVRLVRD
jgi:uncharacterized protein (TIGR02145 family)